MPWIFMKDRLSTLFLVVIIVGGVSISSIGSRVVVATDVGVNAYVIIRVGGSSVFSCAIIDAIKMHLHVMLVVKVSSA